jgi:hypothetical protein
MSAGLTDDPGKVIAHGYHGIGVGKHALTERDLSVKQHGKVSLQRRNEPHSEFGVLRRAHADLGGGTGSREFGMSLATRVALRISAGRLHVAFALRGLPLALALCMARGIALSAAIAVARARAPTRGVTLHALSAAISHATPIATPLTGALAIPGKAGWVATSDDFSGVDLRAASPGATAIRLA